MAAPEAPDLKQQLYDLLSGAGSSAEAWTRPLACSAGPLTRISPGLRIADSAPLKLPLQAEQAAAIKAAAGGGSGGSGGVWVLPAAQLEVANPRWDEVVAEAVRRTKAVLGLHDTRVEARLSRLELHEAGSAVEPAARPPASDDMFGELAILLPSSYQGGQLRVLHDGRDEQVDLAARNAKSSCFAAYYSGCRVGTQPLIAGHRCLLFYDLVWAGGSKPPQPPPERAARLVELSQQWSATPDPPMRICFMLQQRCEGYGETELRERGIEALQGADKAAAQMLLAACQRGADLDVSFTLVKATARPVVDRYVIFEDVCDVYGLSPCTGCGEIHFEDTGLKEEDIWDVVFDILKSVVFDNEPFNGTRNLLWKHVKAAKHVALAGSCPLEPMLLLQTSELLHDGQYFAGPPDRGMVHKDADYRHIMQWRRVGLLVCLRSQRLRNCVHANPARQAVHLYNTLGVQPESSEMAALRTIVSSDGLHGGWLYDDSQGAFATLPPDACTGFDTFEPSVDQGALPASPWEVAEAIASYLADPPAAIYIQGKECCLSALLELAASPQLAAQRPPGEPQLVALLLVAAKKGYITSQLTAAVTQLLRCYQWPANALNTLQSWVLPDDRAVCSGMGLLEACLADAGEPAHPHSANAWATASVLALSLAKGLRLGCSPDKKYYMAGVFKEAHTPLLLLQRVGTAAGSMALEAAVEAVLARFNGEPLVSISFPSLETLLTSCVAVLEALPPHIVAGCPALLKLACSCAVDVQAALEASAPGEPKDWSKQIDIHYTTVCPQCGQLQDFLAKPDQQTIQLPGSQRLDIIVRTYFNETMRRAAPKYSDLDAQRVQLEGGVDGWRFAKSHTFYQQQVAEHAARQQKLDALLQLLLPSLVLALPRCGSEGAAEGEAPPAKAPRLA